MTGLRIKTVLLSLADMQSRPRTVTTCEGCLLVIWGKGSAPPLHAPPPSTYPTTDRGSPRVVLEGMNKFGDGSAEKLDSNGRGDEEVYELTNWRLDGLRGNAQLTKLNLRINSHSLAIALADNLFKMSSS